ncbi:hypothetical protein RJ640_025736 [Escallonia rubra]|uniref:Uncharacterized protein n=1 Tax=Escallonia rubra TaxID=112253 RepID=A0AA88QY97_9ASTE|nr:hypothetical protein RJ640_025736 [Escallonia rubra]
MKAFQKDVAIRWEKIVAAVPGKSKVACMKRVSELKKKSSVITDGVRADSLHVHGVAIPTIDGIRNVLDHIGCLDGKKTQVLWINLREEPVKLLQF